MLPYLYVLAANASCNQYGGCPPGEHRENLPFTGFNLTWFIIVGVLIICLGLYLRSRLDAKKDGPPDA